MSQFYDQASLVMVPSGYKAGKVYSQKPLTTDGQLTFTRTGDTATRVNADGLVEKVRTNSLLQSNSFDRTWTNNLGGTITGGQSGYDGSSDAWLIEKSAVAYRHILQYVTGTGVKTLSVYAKEGTLSVLTLFFRNGSSSDTAVNFDLSAGTYTAVANTNLISANIVSIGSGWYHCQMVLNAVSGNTYRIYADWSDTVAGNIYIQDAQLEDGDIATQYIPTTTAAVSVGPVANLPRIDYTGGGCGKLLLEPQRTNVLTYSEQLSNAVWSKYLTTITDNNVISPSGYQDADLTTSTAGGDLKNILTLATNTTYTASFYVKKGTASDAKYRVYNFDAGVNVVADTSYISQTNTSTWTRVSFTFTTGASGTSHGIYLLQNASAGTMYFWGAQLEAGSYATSYIPTLSAAVTRGADAAYKTGISSLIGQTEGTLFAEMDVKENETSLGIWIRKLSGGFYGDFIALQFNNLRQPRGEVYVGGVLQANILGSPVTAGAHKIAIGYKNNDYVLYVDGVQVGTDTSASVPTCDELYIDQYIDGTIRNTSKKQALLFKTRLTNAQLAELTAL